MDPIKRDIALENEIEVFLKEYPEIKAKRGRPKRELVKDDKGAFNLRAFLRLGLSLSDLTLVTGTTDQYTVNDGIVTSLYDCAKHEGYGGLYHQYLQTFRLILKEQIKLKNERMKANAPEQ